MAEFSDMSGADRLVHSCRKHSRFGPLLRMAASLPLPTRHAATRVR